MKVSLRNRIGEQYLKKADEIKLDYRDINSLPDLYEKFPDKEFLLVLWFEEIDWEKIKEMYILSKGKLSISLSDWRDARKVEEIGMDYMFNFCATTAYSFNSIIENFNVKYIKVSAPLFFDMNFLKPYANKIRLMPNISITDLPQKNGAHGSWIRPEDLDLYEEYCAMIEFEGVRTSAEEALYRIYFEQKSWPGELNMIINNLNYPGINRMLHRDLTEIRLNCKQVCEINGSCSLCERSLLLADPAKIKKYEEEKS